MDQDDKQFIQKDEIGSKSDGVKRSDVDKENRLRGSIEALAIMKSYKELKK